MNQNLQNKLDSLSLNPGVYLFSNNKGKVIYVGKAKVIRNRVKSYFSGGSDGRAQYEALVASIEDIEVIITDSEIEALILEANLIKKYRPRFNVFFRDDKFFPFLKVTKELFPQAFLTRKVIKDGSDYHGPFTEVKQVKRLIKIFKSVFQIRNCSLDITEKSIKTGKHKVCLDYHINLCGGPCEGLVEADDYAANIRQLVALVKGDVGKVAKDLRSEMKIAAGVLNFEYAAKLRDRLKVVEEFAARQTIIFPDEVDRDVFGLAIEDDDGCLVIIKARSGRVQGREHFFVKGSRKKSDNEIISTLLQQYYFSATFIPREIYLPAEPEDLETIAQWLREKRSGAVDIIIPQRGRRAKLLRLADANAQMLLGEKRRETEARDRIPHSLKALQEILRLESPPRRIEAFDISNLQGKHTVASMVVFKDGRPLKTEYRRFNIKTVSGIDDFASMNEVVGRRYRRVLNEDRELPDLILIDGGKGQLSAALRSLRELEVNDQPIIGLAKKLEEVFTPYESEAINIPKTSSALKLLQQVRDEAHRVAITHHRSQRSKSAFGSTLDNIPGVGDNRKRKLLSHFKTIKNISQADISQISSVPGIDSRTAESVFYYFNNNND